MGLKFGGLDVSAIKVGASSVTKIYQGSNLVWPIIPEDLIPPSTVTNFTAISSFYPEIELNWDAATDNVAVSGYDVWESIGGGVWTQIRTNIAGTNILVNGETSTYVEFKVKAVDTSGNRSVNFSNIDGYDIGPGD